MKHISIPSIAVFSLLLPLVVDAVLVETKDQCVQLVSQATPTTASALRSSSSSLTLTWYPPKTTYIRNFIATCVGSNELPTISNNGGYSSLPGKKRYSSDDCDRYIATDSVSDVIALVVQLNEMRLKYFGDVPAAMTVHCRTTCSNSPCTCHLVILPNTN